MCWFSTAEDHGFLTRYVKFSHKPIGKKSNVVKSGNLRGQAIGVPLPIHPPGIM
jgi:hypothetical protein